MPADILGGAVEGHGGVEVRQIRFGRRFAYSGLTIKTLGMEESVSVGAWGVSAFENDSAADWLAGLPAALPQTLELTFRPVVVIEPDLYLEEPEASEALAAAEVVAAMRGHPGEAVAKKPEVMVWAVEHGAWLLPDIVRDALAAVDRIRSSSELRDLWSESDEFESWLATLDDLRGRLQA